MIPPSHMTYVMRRFSPYWTLDVSQNEIQDDPSFQPGFLGEYLILFDILGILGIPPMPF